MIKRKHGLVDPGKVGQHLAASAPTANYDSQHFLPLDKVSQALHSVANPVIHLFIIFSGQRQTAAMPS